MENIFDVVESEIKKDPTRPIVVIGHINPDGDCVGSSLGMKYLIKENYGIEATVVNQELDRMRFLGDWILPGNIEYGHTFVIQCDNATRQRSADPAFMNAEAILKIDHHVPVDSYGHWNFEPQLSSCCEVIAQHAIEKGIKINQDAARALYTGMYTDTGRFLYSKVNSQTHRIAAVLIDTGFNLVETHQKINVKTLESVQYTAYAYSQIKMSEKGIMWMYITKEAIEKYKLTTDMVKLALEPMRDIEGHEIIALFSDLNGGIRVSIRSETISIRKVAERFNGGGHDFASGANLDSPDEIPKLISALEELMP